MLHRLWASWVQSRKYLLRALAAVWELQVYRLGWDFSMLASDGALSDKLLPGGVANGCFAIHPLELSRQVVYGQFWHWWTEEYSC